MACNLPSLTVMNSSLRIGFIDYRLDIAHANTFANRIQKRGSASCELTFCSALDSVSGKLWAEERGIPFVEDIRSMQGQVDGIMIPAASNPEYHLELFRIACQLGVPVFIDKPFAESAQTALQIFKESIKHQVPVFSSSSLRFSDEVIELQQSTSNPRFVQSWGGYNDRFDEFIIHPVETAMSLLGSNVQGVTIEKSANLYQITLHYPDQIQGSIYYLPSQQAYELSACNEERWEHKPLSSPFFERLLDQILNTFRTGTPAVNARDTLAVMKVLDACKTHRYGEFQPVEWSQEEQQLLKDLS